MLPLIQLLSEPPVQDWSFGGRAVVHTTIWAGVLVLQQYLVLGVITLLSKFHLKQSARAPQLSQTVMFVEATLGYIGWAWPTGLYAAWLNPGAPGSFSWGYGPPRLFSLLGFCLFTLITYDTYSYFLHRWLHVNKGAFVWLHAKHHEHKAALDTRSAGYMSVMEGIFSDALPMLFIYALGQLTGNWWMSFLGIWHAFHIVHVGHCGHDASLKHAGNIPILLLNPLAVGFLFHPAHASPKEHEDHHTFPRKNYSYFFTFWDDLYGTSHKQLPHCTVLVIAFSFLWCYLVLVNPLVAIHHTVPFLTSYLLLYVAISPAMASAASEASGLPEATRKVFGWLMDKYRREACITYAEPGTPGAFEPAAAVIPAADDTYSSLNDGHTDDTAPVKDQDTKYRSPAGAPASPAASTAAAPKAPVYLFACHPTGLLSRAALHTFAARGWESPVAGLPKVRFAVASLLFRLPYFPLREMMLAIGLIPAERSVMKQALQAGISVAVTPGGWRESDHLQTYNLVLKRRQGFVQLAAETGAQLVPVLCLGEQDVVGAPEPGFKLIKGVVPNRPMPLHVVFGKPVVPRADESVSQLHSRYTAALLELGKQHNVQLNIVA